MSPVDRQANYKRIVAEVQTILGEYPDITFTLRQMYYRLVARMIIPNNLNEYKKLSKYLTTARENKIIDYERFEDRARKTIGYGDVGHTTVNGFIAAQVRNFKREYRYFRYKQWLDQDEYIEVWLEKDALSQLVGDVADGLNVMTCPSRGYPSFSYVMDGVKRLEDIEKPVVIIYLGDFDPSGLNIPENLLDRYRRYAEVELGRDPETITLERIALTVEQINQYQLPPAPAKTSDARYQSFVDETGADKVVELDALEPNVLQDIVRHGIAKHIDIDLWNETIEKTRRMKEKLRPVFEAAKIEIEDVEDEDEE